MSEIVRKRPSDFHTARLAAFDVVWQQRTLANGMAAIHVPTPHDDHFFLGVMIRAGSRLEVAANNGVSHFLEHLMFRGSERYPEFTRLAEAFEWLGGEWNAATGHEHTEYWYSGIRHTAAEVVSLFADFLARPKLQDIEVERQVIIRELEGETNDHGHSLDLDHHVHTLIWPESTMAMPILGTRESLAAITIDTLRAYRDKYYTPLNMTVCAVGGGDDMLDILGKNFGSYAVGAGNKPTTYPKMTRAPMGPAVKWVQHSDNEYEIKLSFACEGEWSAAAGEYELITRILSDGFCSRLARRLREELGLVYDISASTTLFLDAGTIDIHASCAHDQLEHFLTELFLLLKQFVTEGPGEDELTRSIVRGVVDLELSPTNPEFVGPRLAWGILCGRKVNLVKERERLEKATKESVSALLRQIFRADNAALVALGPPAKDIEKKMKKALVAGLGPA